MKWDVLGIGAVAVDDFYYVDHYPRVNTKSMIVNSVRQGGGLIGTALVAAARLGSHTAYFGFLGEDELSRYTIDELERESVNCSGIERRSGSGPAHSVIIVDSSNGDRTILSSIEGLTDPEPRFITEELVGSCRALLLDHTVMGASLAAVDLAETLDVETIGDFERNCDDPRMEPLLRAVDHLVVGIDFARTVTGEERIDSMLESLSAKRAGVTVLTGGEQGCWWIGPDKKAGRQPAFNVNAVDTTGCGDVFHGAYASRIAAHDTVENAIRIATAAAGIKATRRGGRDGIPDLPTIEQFLRSHSTR